MIEVIHAPPFATVQDRGRPGYRAQGVPISGAMDDRAAALLNAVVGNEPDAALIEWAAGAGTLRMHASATIAVGGATALCATNRAPITPCTATEVAGGDIITLGRPTQGSFCYLAVRGGIDVPVVLGSRSTYLPAAMGGYQGRRLRAGDVLPVDLASKAAGRTLALPPLTRAAERRQPTDPAVLRVLRTTGEGSPDAATAARFFAELFTVSPRSDRTGYRLDGATFRVAMPGDGASRAVCPGAIQIPDSGSPLVLMRDAPTTGGYPVVAVVATADLSTMAQLSPGESVRFVEVSTGEARSALEER